MSNAYPIRAASVLENVPVQATATSRPKHKPGRRKRLPDEPQARRVESLRRAYQRGIGRKLTLLERAAMLRAATLTVRAEMAALDANASLEDVVRLDNAAARARAKLVDLVGSLKRHKPVGPTFGERLMREAKR
jgi:hypothetical protein